jgi:hypothetical protein
VTAGGAASMTLDPVGATGTSDAIHSELSGGTRQVKVFNMPNLHDGPSAGSFAVLLWRSWTWSEAALDDPSVSGIGGSAVACSVGSDHWQRGCLC